VAVGTQRLRWAFRNAFLPVAPTINHDDKHTWVVAAMALYFNYRKHDRNRGKARQRGQKWERETIEKYQWRRSHIDRRGHRDGQICFSPWVDILGFRTLTWFVSLSAFIKEKRRSRCSRIFIDILALICGIPERHALPVFFSSLFRHFWSAWRSP